MVCEAAHPASVSFAIMRPMASQDQDGLEGKGAGAKPIQEGAPRGLRRSRIMNRNFALEFVRVTEAAALESARWMGRGDEKAADQAAVEAMRKMMNSIDFDGKVVIGEGERDEAPMLYIGEKVGKGQGAKLDLALDPLEGTTICARGGQNALSVIAIAEEGHFLHAPDTYMQKIAVGPWAKGAIDLKATPTENLKNIARAKKCHVEDLTVIILDRPRHADLISEVRRAGARIYMIGDGDVSAAIATCKPRERRGRFDGSGRRARGRDCRSRASLHGRGLSGIAGFPKRRRKNASQEDGRDESR